jgi:hypothetical protein
MKVLGIACLLAAVAAGIPWFQHRFLLETPEQSRPAVDKVAVAEPEAAAAVTTDVAQTVAETDPAESSAVTVIAKTPAAPPEPIAAPQTGLAPPPVTVPTRTVVASLEPVLPPQSVIAARQLPPDMPATAARPARADVGADDDTPSWEDHYPVPTKTQPDLSYLADYVYAEVPPPRKPAQVVLESLADTPIGTPIEEIDRAAYALGLNATFMEAVAKIESDFDPKQRTGSYIGLFQLSQYEFRRYGSGDIINARDNAVAAAMKFATAAALFELETHKKATFNDLYLIHQQGTEGAAEHILHPDWAAWKSMCATSEGKQKGERWCKRAIWGNALPDVKHTWKTVDNLTSRAFVQMWGERIQRFYARYSEATVAR